MAGEWLKFEANTPEKPEVFSITAAMGWDDPDLTVGKLLKVWRWFDQQTIDGNAPSVTLALLDRISGVTGFAKCMCDAGWLTQNDIGLSLPNFDRHNGKTAKDRAQTAKRAAKHRSNAESNGDSVTSALPREEKRREEKKEPKAKAESAPASRLPADWMPDMDCVLFCRQARPELSIQETASRFRDYWIAQPGAKGRKVDWPATWRNWVRNEKAFPARASPGYQTANEKAKSWCDELLGVTQNDQHNEFIDITPAPGFLD